MPSLPQELADLYIQRRQAILARLADFAAIRQDQWFYELCYCLLTPQSKAAHASSVIEHLKADAFFEHGGDMVHHLRNKSTYIRFHNVKHSRLQHVRTHWNEIESLLLASTNSSDSSIASDARTSSDAKVVRDALVSAVPGFGMKEASHFLRNIGYRGLAILDRHLLTNLVRCGVYAEVPPVSSPLHYRSVEAEFLRFAICVKVDPDELDLLFWSAQTGIILK